jgi:hypothetical protein
MPFRVTHTLWRKQALGGGPERPRESGALIDCLPVCYDHFTPTRIDRPGAIALYILDKE